VAEIRIAEVDEASQLPSLRIDEDVFGAGVAVQGHPGVCVRQGAHREARQLQRVERERPGLGRPRHGCDGVVEEAAEPCANVGRRVVAGDQARLEQGLLRDCVNATQHAPQVNQRTPAEVTVEPCRVHRHAGHARHQGVLDPGFGDAPTKDSWNAYALQACQLLQQETLLVQARSRAQLLWSLNLQDQAVVDRIGARLAAALVDGPDGLRARRMQAHDREHRVGIEHRVGRVGLYVEVLAHVCPPTSTLMPIPACRLHGQQRSEATPAPNQLVRRALFEDAAVLDHDDAIGLLRR
jgi:hypothetical protein